MNLDLLVDIGRVVVCTFVGGLFGALMVLVASVFIPKIIERLTPKLDEEKEIARGNVAVAEYFGRVVAACIIGVSIVVAAAVIGGSLVALYGGK